MGRSGEHHGQWTFLTNHFLALICIARDPDIRLRDIAERVKITERAVQRIVSELIDEGYVSAQRVGRRNHYAVNPDRPMRHPVEGGLQIGDVLPVLQREPAPSRRGSGAHRDD